MVKEEDLAEKNGVKACKIVEYEKKEEEDKKL